MSEGMDAREAPLDPRMLVREFARVMEKSGEHALAQSMLANIDDEGLQLMMVEYAAQLTKHAEDVIKEFGPPG
jgi:hypothetical protein